MCGQGGHAGVEGASRLETQPPISSSWARWSPHPSCASTEAYRGLMIGIRHAHIEQTVLAHRRPSRAGQIAARTLGGKRAMSASTASHVERAENIAVSLVHRTAAVVVLRGKQVGLKSVVSTRSV